jgi:hypothetical protein
MATAKGVAAAPDRIVREPERRHAKALFSMLMGEHRNRYTIDRETKRKPTYSIVLSRSTNCVAGLDARQFQREPLRSH